MGYLEFDQYIHSQKYVDSLCMYTKDTSGDIQWVYPVCCKYILLPNTYKLNSVRILEQLNVNTKNLGFHAIIWYIWTVGQIVLR